MTSTYTSNPPSNATAFKALARAHASPGADGGGTAATSSGASETASGTRSSPSRATSIASSPSSAPRHSPSSPTATSARPSGSACTPEWNTRVWPVMLELSGRAADGGGGRRVAAEKAAAGALTRADSNTAMAMSLVPATSGRCWPPGRPCLDHASHVVGSLRAASSRGVPEPAAAQHRATGAARSEDPDEHGRRPDHRGPCPGLPRTPGRRVAQAHAAPGDNGFRQASGTGPATTSESARRTTRSGLSASRVASVPRSTGYSWCLRR